MRAPPKGFLTPQYAKEMMDRGYLFFSQTTRVYDEEPLPLMAEGAGDRVSAVQTI